MLAGTALAHLLRVAAYWAALWRSITACLLLLLPYASRDYNQLSHASPCWFLL
jgi:hypothetical protein